MEDAYRKILMEKILIEKKNVENKYLLKNHRKTYRKQCLEITK